MIPKRLHAPTSRHPKCITAQFQPWIHSGGCLGKPGVKRRRKREPCAALVRLEGTTSCEEMAARQSRGREKS
jgi:hypothetical protein